MRRSCNATALQPGSRSGCAKRHALSAGRYPGRREAMARAFQTGVYTMREIADYFGVHYAT